jgi:hypothetical protein
MVLCFNSYWRQTHGDSDLWRSLILAVMKAGVG